MSFDDFIKGGNIVKQDTSKAEVQELLAVASRSLRDANALGLSSEGRFTFAYDAALQLSTIPLRCAGYRTRGQGHHWTIFNVLPDLMGKDVEELADHFQTCRGKRSTAIYRQSSVVTKAEADALCDQAHAFAASVRQWLSENYPQYV